MQAAALGPVAFSFDAFTFQTAQLGRFYNLLTYSKFKTSVGIVFFPHNGQKCDAFFQQGRFLCLHKNGNYVEIIGNCLYTLYRDVVKGKYIIHCVCVVIIYFLKIKYNLNIN